jgi:hypothetical protein
MSLEEASGWITSLGSRSKKLDQYHYQILCWLKEHPDLSSAQVEDWLKEGKIKGEENDGIYAINENKIYEFLEDYRWEGTANEKGIDDKTKINRLQEEIY